MTPQVADFCEQAHAGDQVNFLVGIGFGAALAGARFGFTTGWRQLVEQRDARGVSGQLLLLALAAAVAMPLLGQFGELQAALGPPSISLRWAPSCSACACRSPTAAARARCTRPPWASP